MRLGASCPADSVGVVESLKRSGDPVVVCTHGEVIEYLQHHLRGAKRAEFGADQPREKRAMWVLHLENQAVASAQCVLPINAR